MTAGKADERDPRKPKTWLVVTRATVIRHYMVKAADEKAAEEASTDATCEYEEDENEETMSIREVTKK